MKIQYRVIIPGNDADLLNKCLEAIRKNQPGAQVVVVWDGPGEYTNGDGVEVIQGAKPFSFAKNCNLGIRAAGEDDVILLNQDAILLTPNGFDLLAAASKYFGIVSAAIRGRCRPGQQLSEEPTTRDACGNISFMAVYIPRETISEIGLLDENYELGAWEDDDYCFRARVAEKRIGVCGACVVRHDHVATIEKSTGYIEAFNRNKSYYIKKIGKDRLVLTICIASLHSRESYLSRLMGILKPQIGLGVQVVIDADWGNASIGEKRQRLLQAARGEFVVFVDDDDTIAPDYIKRIFLAVHRGTNPDAITYDGARYVDGVFDAPINYSLKYSPADTETMRDYQRVYLRTPGPKTPIKRELAQAVGFNDMNGGVDYDFAKRIYHLLKTEEHIDGVLYHYRFRINKIEHTNESMKYFRRKRVGDAVINSHTTPEKLREYAARYAELMNESEDARAARPLLSICVCTLKSRARYLERLMRRLKPQLTSDVVLMVSSDDGEVSIGEKRNRMLRHANGQYICFVDDDDLVSRDYVKRIIDAIRESRPDCVTFSGKSYFNGKYNMEISYRMKSNVTRENCREYHNFGPFHLTPIRREIALAVQFPDANVSEDFSYAGGCESLIKTESFIDAPLYLYLYRTDRGGEITNDKKLNHKESELCHAL